VLLGSLIGLGAAQAQSLPEGWSARAENNGVTLSPRDLRSGEIFELWLPPRSAVQPGVSLQNQMQRIRQQVGATQGTQCAPPETGSNGEVQQKCVDGMALLYSLLPLPGGRQTQLMLMRVKGGDDLSRHLGGMEAVLKFALMGNASALLDAQQGSANAGASRGSGTSARANARNTPDPAPDDWDAIAKAIRTAPGTGIAESQIANVYVVSENRLIPGSSISQLEHTTFLLLKDGTAYKKLVFPPDELNLEVSRRLEGREWTQWRNRGGVIEIRLSNGEWEDKEGWVAKPVRGEKRLNGSFTSYSMSGNMFTGSSSSQRTWTFSRDGRFETSVYATFGSGTLQEAGGNTNVTTSRSSASGSATASSSSSSFPGGARVGAGSGSTRGRDLALSGAYNIKGWVLEVQRDNGATERRLITFGEGEDILDIDGDWYLVKE
jgi:hypothetical protein